jgi:hypothetical protein
LVLDAVWKNEESKKTKAEAKLILPTLVHDSVICGDECRTLPIGKVDDGHVVGIFRQAALNRRLHVGRA